MSYTVKILSKEKRNDTWKAVLEYSDGAKTFKKGYSLEPMTEERAKGMLRAKVAELDSFDLDVFPFPLNEVLDLTAKEVVKPTPKVLADSEIAQNEWLNNFYKMKKYEQLISMGVMTSGANEVTELKAMLKNDYLPDYLEFI